MSFLKRWDESLDKAFGSKYKELENKIKGLEKFIADASRNATVEQQALISRVETVEKTLATIPQEEVAKIEDLKTRIERLEIYSGITRKVDPSKPAMLKSPFEM